MPPEIPKRRLDDAQTLRAMAHPLRLKLVDVLAIEGAMTASDLAVRLNESPSNCSWHLRQLERAGFVERAEGGTGRRRPWQAVLQSNSFNDGRETDPEVVAAGRALGEMLTEHEVTLRREFLARETSEGPEWREASFATSSLAWLTPEELAELNEAIQGLMMARIERYQDPAARPQGSRPVRLVAWGFPTDTPASPSPRGRS